MIHSKAARDQSSGVRHNKIVKFTGLTVLRLAKTGRGEGVENGPKNSDGIPKCYQLNVKVKVAFRTLLFGRGPPDVQIILHLVLKQKQKKVGQNNSIRINFKHAVYI